MIHKLLITELLKDGPAYKRLMQKTSKFDATLDYEQEGGVELGDDPLGEDEEIEEVKFEIVQPDTPPETPLSPVFASPFPPLPSFRAANDTCSEVASTLGAMFLGDVSESSTVVGSPVTATSATGVSRGGSTREGSSTQVSTAKEASTRSADRQPKAWGSRNGKSASNVLFPNAKPTPAPSEFSIAAHDEAMERAHGGNIMRTRFWDPEGDDWNPEHFYDSLINAYYCPFICE